MGTDPRLQHAGACLNLSPYLRRGSQPVSRVLSRTIIHLGCMSPCTSSSLPGGNAGHIIAPLFGLAPGGVYHAVPVASHAVRSYRTISPLPGRSCRPGGIFSVALSVGSRRPGITWRPAPVEPGLSSAETGNDRNQPVSTAIARLTPAIILGRSHAVFNRPVRQAGIIQAVEDLTPSTTDKENWITL